MREIPDSLKAEIKALNAQHKEKAKLVEIYELGKQSAHRGDSIDNKPAYRKQNRAAAWLKGFADGQREQQDKVLSRSMDKAGIAKLKAIVKDALQD
jgi:hypothetical protein